MVRLAQTVHLSCMDTNIITEQTEMRFHMADVTKEYHRVRLKGFLNLGFV
jgi:hypothetical protein